MVSASGLHLHRLPHAQSGVGRGLPRVSVTLSPPWGRGLLLRRGGALSSTPGFRLRPPSGCDNQKCLQIWPHVPWGHDCPSLGTTAAEKELRLRKSTWYMGGGGGERGASAKPDLETPHRGAPEASQLSLASALDSLSVLVRFPTSLRPSALSVEKLGCSQCAPCRVVGDSRKMSRAKGAAPGLAALKFSAVLAWALLCQLLHTLINRFRFLCLRGSLDTGYPSASLFL